MGLCLIASWDSTLNLLWMIGSVACGLGFVIFVHELGHFLVAKMCGVKCEKFYIGFDVPISLGPIKLPSRLGRFQWGETEYGIGIIPLGGYVKMLGQDDDPRAAAAEAERIKVRKGESSSEGVPGNTDSAASPTTPFVANTASSAAPQADAVTPGGDDEEFELDPRSFPAKTVPQRMAIISAGVIMNLIFAVIFATLAFSSGVSYTPCEVGEVVPGSPAWVAGVRPGDRIISLGNGDTSEHLRFDWDLRNAVHMAGNTDDVPMRIRRIEGEEVSISLPPVIHKIDGEEYPMLGIAQAATRVLAEGMPVAEGYPASTAEPPLMGGDKVVAIDGQSVQDAYQIRSMLARVTDRAITVTVERHVKNGSATRQDIAVPPNHIKRLGLVMKPAGISGIYPGSPAEISGLQLGDVIVAVDGEPVVDPMTLPTHFAPYWGQYVDLQVLRDGVAEPTSVKVRPEAPSSYENVFSLGSPMAVQSLGIVFPIDPTVVSINENSVAEKQGFATGDKVVAVQFSSTDTSKKSEDLMFNGEEVPLDDQTITWPFIYSKLQEMAEDSEITLVIERNGTRTSMKMQPQVTDEFYAERGLVFTRKSEIHKAGSLVESVALGFRQTKEDLERVGAFLKKLVTGGISPKKLGGPLSIATVAGLEASESVSRLLIFLTFLSANLAIVNFLPIPALDGGHMVFLTVEWVRGKPVDERLQMTLTLVGVACLLCLMIFVSGMDIRRLFF